MSEGRRHLHTEHHDRKNRANWWAASYWGSRKDAKEVSAKARRANAKVEIRNAVLD